MSAAPEDEQTKKPCELSSPLFAPEHIPETVSPHHTMRFLPSASTFRPFVTFAAALFTVSLITATAGAQTSVFATNRDQNECPPGTWDFGRPIANSAQTCDRAGLTSESWASANYGILRTSASSSIDKNTFGKVANIGSATWWDWLTITTGNASFAKFDFAINGNTMRSTGELTSTHSAWKSYATATFSSTENGLRVTRNYVEIPTAGVTNPYLRPSNIEYSDRFSLLVPIVNGEASLRYGLESESMVEVSHVWTNLGIAENPAFSAASMFGSTAGITGVSFLDASGLAASDVTYEFRYGTQFYNPDTPTTTVPEPSAWLLISAGLAGLYAIARARRPFDSA